MSGCPQHRRVVLALFRSALRSARQYEHHSVRALSETELTHELEDMRFCRLREQGGGLLLSQLISMDFKSNVSESDPAVVQALIDRGFCALRKIDALNHGIKPPEPRAARSAPSVYGSRLAQRQR